MDIATTHVWMKGDLRCDASWNPMVRSCSFQEFSETHLFPILKGAPVRDPFLQLGISYNVSMLCGEYHFSNRGSSCFVVKVSPLPPIWRTNSGTGTFQLLRLFQWCEDKNTFPKTMMKSGKKDPGGQGIFHLYTSIFWLQLIVDSGVYSISNWLRCCLLNFIRMNHLQIYVYIYLHIPYIRHQWLYDWYATTTWKARHEKRCFKMFVSCRVMCVYIYIHTYLFFSCPRKFVWAKQNQAHLRPWRDLWGKSITQSILPNASRWIQFGGCQNPGSFKISTVNQCFFGPRYRYEILWLM